jgi:MFS family permease
MGTRHPVALTFVLSGVQLLAVLDGLAASLALPAIGADLGMGTAGEAWTLNATSVALAGGLLVSGRLADVLGRRPVFLAGTGLLAVGSVVTALAPTVAVLMGGRALIGLGAAVAYPSALALTNEVFDRDPWRTRAFAVSAVSGATGALAGAVYGGVVTDLLGWRWVFWLTVPVTMALFVAGLAVLPSGETRTRSRSLDLPGAALGTGAVTALVAGIIGWGTDSLPIHATGGLALGATLCAALLVRHEKQARDPLLPGTVVRSRRLLGGCGGIAASSALWSVVVFVLSQELQHAGWSPGRAGVAILPCSVGIVVGGAFVVPRLRRRIGSVRTTIAGLVCGAAAVAWLSVTTTHPTSGSRVLPAQLLLGLALAATSTGLKEHTLKDAPQGAAAVSAAVFESSTHVGGAISVATYAALLATGSFAMPYAAAAVMALAGAACVALLQGSAGRSSTEPSIADAGGREPSSAA